MLLTLSSISDFYDKLTRKNIYITSLLWAVIFLTLTVATSFAGTGLALVVASICFFVWFVGNILTMRETPLLWPLALLAAYFIGSSNIKNSAYIVDSAMPIKPFEVQVSSGILGDTFYTSIPELVEVSKGAGKHQSSPYLITASSSEGLFEARFICGSKELNSTCGKVLD